MKNLAGDKNADLQVREELYLAGIPMEEEISEGEVPYKTIGRIGKWTFRRAWYYWIVSTKERKDGIPLEVAMELHNRKNPIDDTQIMGTSIRCGGHCGCPAPNEYGADPLYDEEFYSQLRELGYKEQYSDILKKSYIPITVGEVSELCNQGKLKVNQYVSSYHVDDQIGLNLLAETLKNLQA